MKRALHIGAHEELIYEYFLFMKENWAFDYVLHQDSPRHKFQEDASFNGDIFIVTPYAKSKINNFLNVAGIVYSHRSKYDVMHFHGGRSQILLVLWCRLVCSAQVIAHAHTFSDVKYSWFRTILNKASELIFSYCCHSLLACSENAGKFLFGKARFTILKNVIDYRKFATCRQGNVGCPTVIMMADYIPSKNHLFAIDIINKVVVEGEREFRVEFYGADKGQKGLLEEKIEQFALEHIISINDRTERADLAYASADILLMPSFFEGFGMAAIEGQASNLECIVSSRLPMDVKISDHIAFLSLEHTRIWCETLRNAISYIRSTEQRNYPVLNSYNSNVYGCSLAKIYEGHDA